MAEPARNRYTSNSSDQHGLALNLDSSKLRAANDARTVSSQMDGAANDNGVGDSGVQGSEMSDTSLEQSGRSVLELEPQSYTKREETEADRASKFQQNLRETQERFTSPGVERKREGGGGAAPEAGFSERMKAKQGGQAEEEGESDQMERYRQMEEQKAKAKVDAAASAIGMLGPEGKAAEGAIKVSEKVIGAQALVAIGAKATVASNWIWILPIFWLVLCVNLEALAVFFTGIKISPSLQSRVINFGLDLTPNKKGTYKVITVAAAVLVDIVIMELVYLVALLIYAGIYISNMSGWDIVKVVTGQ